MGLVTSNTNLKSLKFGKDRPGGGSSNQPYITKDIPSNNSAPSSRGTTDFLLRGGLSLPSRIFNDASRLTQMFFDTKSPSGIYFTAKQNLLSRTGVKTQSSSGLLNEGIYLPTSSILQAAGTPIGLHLNKQGINPMVGTPKYLGDKLRDQDISINRLIRLKDTKILNNGNFVINSLSNDSISNSNITLFSYSGGPGSVLGVGNTIIKRYSNTEPFTTEQLSKSGYYLLNSKQISIKPQSKDETHISDFREELIDLQNNREGGFKKNIISKSLDYTKPNQRIEGRVNLGDPGRRDKNTMNFEKGLFGISGSLGALDKINALPIYSSNTEKHPIPTTSTNDLVKFRIGIIDNEDPNYKQYIHFRAFIDSFSDGYNAEHSTLKYMGRGENFYKYQGFDRKINMSWTVAAQSKEELIPMYKKLNYLASSIAPDYSDKGYMRGNLVSLTVGGYLYEQVGILHSILYTVPEESPWEIGIGLDGGFDHSVKELPHIIRVTGFQFTPIHNFLPKKNKISFEDGEVNGYGRERYISLSNGAGNNYDRQKVNNIPTNVIGATPLTFTPRERVSNVPTTIIDPSKQLII